MNKLAIATVVAGLMTVTAFAAEAKDRKPMVCTEFTEMTMPIDGDPTKVAVCTSGKRPVIMTTYTIVTVKDDEGKSVRAAVGYR